MTDTHRLGELQLAIMKLLWTRGSMTVNEVHSALEAERGLAPSTIATMLRKMEAKGVVTHEERGRQFLYCATVLREDVSKTMVGDLLSRLFGGSPTALVSHLISEQEIAPEELERLRAVIDAAQDEENDDELA